MRIVHLVDYFQPALGYQEFFLAREQIKLGHDAMVVTSDRYAPYPDYDRTARPILGDRIQQPGQRVEEGIPTIRLKTRYEKSFRTFLSGVRSTLEEYKPDIVHAHTVCHFTTLQAVLHKPKLHYRLLVDDHMHRVNLNTGIGGRLFYAFFRSFCAPFYRKHADALVGITEETAGIMKEVFGLSHPAIQVIELGVDTERFQPDEKARQEARQRLGLKADDFLVIYTGKLVPAKAPHWLLEALGQCPNPVKALLVGNASGQYREQIDETLQRQNLENRVFFQPAVRQEQLPRFYAAADAACWPRETSMAMLEAAACALPIVVVEEGVADRVQYNNGLQYPEGNIHRLAQCLQALYQNRQKASAMGVRGRQLVQEHYSWQKINEQFMEAYLTSPEELCTSCR
jgi:glycosyltransferase involved in cell wall biosynthesis